MSWVRQRLVLILFSAFVAIQAVSALLQFMTLAQLKRLEDGVWISNTKSIGEEVARHMPKRQEMHTKYQRFRKWSSVTAGVKVVRTPIQQALHCQGCVDFW